MRNAIIGALILGAAIFLSFNKPPQQREWKLNLNDVELNATWSVIEQSNAPHLQVEEVKKMIQGKLQGQNTPPLPDTTKKAIDTTHNKNK